LRSRHLRLAAGDTSASAADEAEASDPDGDAASGQEEDKTYYFGGVSEKAKEPEEKEVVQVASRINQALAMRRAPKKSKPDAPVDTAWYDELGLDPKASADQIRLRYLELAVDAEEQLAYLLEEGGDENSLLEDEVRALEEASEDELQWEDFGPRDDDEEDANPSEALLLRAAGNIVKAPEDIEAELTESEIVAAEFARVSNLYQILSVPSLRRIYDEEGLEGLSRRVPKLQQGLLEPERALKMAQGIETPENSRPELFLRHEPKVKTFRRYMASNSISQVMRRMSDAFNVGFFRTPGSLEERQGTIFTELPEIAVFGRTNSGKSAMLKSLFSTTRPNRLDTQGWEREHRLWPQSKDVQTTKGMDMTCINRRFCVTDTPGYSYSYGREQRHLKSSLDAYNTWQTTYKPLVEEYLDTTPWMRAAIFTFDIGTSVCKEDLEMVQMLKKRDIPVLLVFTRDDKVSDDSQRYARVRHLRKALKWPTKWPHAHYKVRRGVSPTGHAAFKKMVLTMMLGLLSTETREDAMYALENELSEIFWDYRDKWAPKAPWGRRKERKVNTYPDEDKLITEADLEAEEIAEEKRELAEWRQEKREKGERLTPVEQIMQSPEPSSFQTPEERRKRWEDLLQAARS